MCMHKAAIVIAFALLMAVIAPPGQGKSWTDRRHRPQKRKAHSTRINCLPPGIRFDEVVSYEFKGRGNVTVEKKLAQIKAQCRNRKLVDAKGREIRFHRTSCWGNPPADYQEIQQRENEELQRLQKRYTVIVFGCNPMISRGGTPWPPPSRKISAY
jgi:hypothetical protein